MLRLVKGRYSTFAGTLLLLPLSLAELPVNFTAVILSGWLNIVYLGLFASALAYLIWNLALIQIGGLVVLLGTYLASRQ